MSEAQELMGRIHHVIKSAAQFNDEQFRLVLEGLVKKGGKEAEFLLIQYISTKDTATETRINIIRSMGYIQNVVYLMPLKKIMEQEPDIRLKKAAIMTLAKYNNERALNILNTALASISNPILLKTVNEQIQLIKQNHPILSLMPRFLKGGQDLKAFMVSMGILKKLLSPKDVSSFLKYKDVEDPVIRKGVFELLCYCGDDTLKQQVVDIFKERVKASTCLDNPECEELRSLTSSFQFYLEKYPVLLDTLYLELKSLFFRIADVKIKKTLSAMFCRSKNPEVFVFIKEVYEKEQALRETIIESSAGNSVAVTFLFDQYKSGQELKEKVVKSLLISEQGLRYFIQHFTQFELEQQEMIVRNLPFGKSPLLIKFMKHILETGAHSLKRQLLKTIRDYYFYSFKEQLFDPQRQEEFFTMEDDYVKTIFAVFPVTATRQILIRVAEAELSLPQIHRYFNYIRQVMSYELALTFNHPGDSERITKLITRIIKLNSPDLDEAFLSILENFRTFDYHTYRHFSDALNFFVNEKTKDEELPEGAKLILRRIRDNWREMLDDIRRIEGVDKEIKAALAKSIPDLVLLKRIVESNGLALSFKFKPLIAMMLEYFNNAEDKVLAHWRHFFKGFPLLTRLMRESRGQEGQPEPKNTLLEQLRIVLSFEEPELTSLFLDQINEVVPSLNVSPESPHLNEADMLICDTECFKKYVDRNAMTTRRIFLLLNNRGEFSHYKNYNPRTFLQPISLHKTVRNILTDLFLKTE